MSASTQARRSWAVAAAMALLVLPLAVPPAEAPAPSPRSVCLADVGEAALAVPGEWREARVWHRERTRDVDLDKDVALRVMALAHLLEGGVRMADVVDVRERRTETCVLDRLATLDGQGVLNALALGAAGAGEELSGSALAALVTERHVVARFEYSLDQDVELKREVTLGVLALGRASGPVRLADVVDVERRERVELVYESRVTIDQEDALLALTLGGGGGAAPARAAAAPATEPVKPAARPEPRAVAASEAPGSRAQPEPSAAPEPAPAPPSAGAARAESTPSPSSTGAVEPEPSRGTAPPPAAEDHKESAAAEPEAPAPPSPRPIVSVPVLDAPLPRLPLG